MTARKTRFAEDRVNRLRKRIDDARRADADIAHGPLYGIILGIVDMVAEDIAERLKNER